MTDAKKEKTMEWLHQLKSVGLRASWASNRRNDDVMSEEEHRTGLPLDILEKKQAGLMSRE
jgi:hypothetical protein